MVVEAVFNLGGRLVLTPGVKDEHARGLIGTVVRVVCPGGRAFLAKVVSIEMPTPNLIHRYPIGLASTSLDHAVPLGAEIWTQGGS